MTSLNPKEKPLHGIRLLNTKPYDLPIDFLHRPSLNAEIESLGGTVIHLPMLTIRPLPFHERPISNTDHVIFTSVHAVYHCFESLSLPWPEDIKTFAIGKKTAMALEYYGITPHGIASEENSNSLLSEYFQNVHHDTSIVIIKGQSGLTILEDYFLDRTSKVAILATYARYMPDYPADILQSIWRDKKVNVVLFTSGEAMHYSIQLFAQHRGWLQRLPCVVISERLADIARALGFERIFTSSPSSITTSLLDIVEEI
jgi:uroporphyrinogen-III synthase